MLLQSPLRSLADSALPPLLQNVRTKRLGRDWDVYRIAPAPSAGMLSGPRKVSFLLDAGIVGNPV